MKVEILEKANELQSRIRLLKLTKSRLAKSEFYKPTFGISIEEYPTNFLPIASEPELTPILTEVTIQYCDMKLEELQKEFDDLK